MRNHTQDESLGQDGRHVFDRVDRQINPARLERLFNLLHKQPFAANTGQRDILEFITGGFDGNQLNPEGRPVLLQPVFYPLRLPQRQGAASRSDPDDCAHKLRGAAAYSSLTSRPKI